MKHYVVTRIPGSYYYGNYKALTNNDMALLLNTIDEALNETPSTAKQQQRSSSASLIQGEDDDEDDEL